MRRGAVALALATGAFWWAAWVDATPFLRGPAPYPPEWRWPYRRGMPAEIDPAVLACAAGLLGLLVASGSSRARRRPLRSALLLTGLAIPLGAGLQVSLLGLEGPRSGLSELMARTASPAFTQYYNVAIAPEARDVAAFLDGYAGLLPAFHRQATHAATNPPGAVLFFRAVLALCERSPWLARAAAARAAAEDPSLAGLPDGVRARVAALLVAPLALALLGSATALAVLGLARSLGVEPLAAARIGILWTALPGPTLLVPEIDQLLSFLGASASLLLARAAGRDGAGGPALAAAAGACLAAALFTSYGAAVFAVFAVGFALAPALDRLSPGRLARLGAALALAPLALLGLLLLAGYDPIAAFRGSMELHFGAFTLRRSYLAWLLFNPWDLAVFTGLPIALLCLSQVPGALAALRRGRRWPAEPASRAKLFAAAALAALFLSGILRGETGRSLMPLMPFLLLCACVRPLPGSAQATGPDPRQAAFLAMLLLPTCWLLRVSWRLP